jgi:hypothetical protein
VHAANTFRRDSRCGASGFPETSDTTSLRNDTTFCRVLGNRGILHLLTPRNKPSRRTSPLEHAKSQVVRGDVFPAFNKGGQRVMRQTKARIDAGGAVC